MESVPFGFKRNENGSCECCSELGGEIKCDSDKQVVSIMVGYCMTIDNSSQELVVGFNNDRCFNDRSTRAHQTGVDHTYNALPKNTAELQKICSKRKRKGMFCGECMDNYGPTFNS